MSNKTGQQNEGSEQTYTPQDVLNQSLIALGQGTGCVRVSSRAAREFVRLMTAVEEKKSLHEDWGRIAVQMLERMRTIGRVAASLTLDEGRVHINDEDIAIAFRRVQGGSKTEMCETSMTGREAPNV